MRVLGLALMFSTTLWWMTTGAHRGWSMNKVPVNQVDEITGIAYVEYEERFVPGVDVLIVGTGTGGLLLLAAFFLRSKTKSSST